ncbi:hypothetical protein BJX70DRAFT_362461, partial [Aspergillus crustosus]
MACSTEDSNDNACEKPTSDVLLYAVPACIGGVLLIIAGIFCYMFVKRYQRRERAEDERMEMLVAFRKLEPTDSSEERHEDGNAYYGGRGRGRGTVNGNGMREY